MDKIEWCVKRGMCLVKPNSNLANAYVKKASEALESISLNTVRDWKISTAYYSIYFSLYAILMKLGVKCEIHSCTIEFAKRSLNEFFSDGDLEFFEDSLKARIDSQYYLDRTVSDKQYNMMLTRAPDLFVKCKSIIIKLNEKRIEEIRRGSGLR